MSRSESPEEKQRRVLEAFRAKVEILERWAVEGVPEGSEVPKTHAALRRWTGPDGSLAQWADPLIDRPKVGKYPDLTERYQQALRNIELRLRKSKVGRLGDLEAQLAVLRRENDALLVQNASLVGLLDQRERRIVLLEDLARAHKLPVPPPVAATSPKSPR